MLLISYNVKTPAIKSDHVLKISLHSFRIFAEIIFRKIVVVFELKIEILAVFRKVDNHSSWCDFGDVVKKHSNNNKINKIRNINYFIC